MEAYGNAECLPQTSAKLQSIEEEIHDFAGSVVKPIVY